MRGGSEKIISETPRLFIVESSKVYLDSFSNDSWLPNQILVIFRIIQLCCKL